MAGPKLVCFYRQIWKVQGNWNGWFEMGMLIQKVYRACQCDFLILGHKLPRKDGIAQPKGEAAVYIEENFSVKSDS